MNRHTINARQSTVLARRRFLKQMFCASMLAMNAGIANAAVQKSHAIAHKTIALLHPQTGDQLSLTYFEHGRYLKDALHEIDHLLRDFHTGDVHPIDPALLDQLHDLKQLLGVRQPIQVVSGYRSPFTNANLRHQSHRVAKHSLHMEGRAIDIRIDGVSTATLKRAALAMQRGGVGYYPRADFVHLDTGEVRTW
ncbi:MAG: DUF882 domain-containing protein [Methylovulum sp.]|uniref:YcbK family protein n=1 Tax=Methylovulum sp. TaxID=1916980 RepID=UPI00260BD7E3|nr:DUF882 domain-containing protein [Methylovulum sp.]MDD2723355.1 DUF882 domain-containing protein [Methylovulum sp.]MDD5125334.1 DUF882 domain-containing protein [Methylovulum sp.]